MMFYDFGRKFQGIVCDKMKRTEAWDWGSLNLSPNSATSLVSDLKQVSEPVWAPKSWSGSGLWVSIPALRVPGIVRTEGVRDQEGWDKEESGN